MKESPIKRRIFADRAFQAFVALLSFCAILPMFFILFFITKNGVAVINWNFLTRLPAPVGETGGGIANGIIGSALLIVISSVIALPVGVLTGIYLA
jgi:phosphate transport system permease protein